MNYLYDLARIDENHEAFAARNVVVASKQVQALAAQPLPSATSRTDAHDESPL